MAKQKRRPRGAAAPETAPAPAPEAKSRRAKVLATVGTLAAVAVGAFFTGIGETIVNRVADALTADSTPSLPDEPKEAFSIVLTNDIGEAPDRLALRKAHPDGAIALRLQRGKLGQPAEDFLAEQDGAPVENMRVNLVLTGHRETGISITGIDFVKLRTEPSLRGTLIPVISQGQAETIQLSADLDEAQPKIMKGKDVYFSGQRITLKTGEQESISFLVTGAKAYYRWILGIDYVDEKGAAQRLYLDRQGRRYPDAAAVPDTGWFALTGAASGYGATWEVTEG